MSIFAVKKTVFDTLHANILYESLTTLEAEIFRSVLHLKGPVSRKDGDLYFLGEAPRRPLVG